MKRQTKIQLTYSLTNNNESFMSLCFSSKSISDKTSKEKSTASRNDKRRIDLLSHFSVEKYINDLSE